MARGRLQSAHRAAILDEVFRRESPRIVATLVRLLRDIDLAEEVLQETIVAAIENWARSGVPENPAAWLTAVAKNRAIDQLRRGKLSRSKNEELAREQSILELQTAMDDGRPSIPDDRLQLIFTCCHPALATENRVALTLRLVGVSQRLRSRAPFWFRRQRSRNGSFAPSG